ncbi:MAG: tetratricopeptide repeat protein [Thermoplasmata archaeon]|nr:tetratricopeptide repeat protein [Thermoplasmata archaeon]
MASLENLDVTVDMGENVRVIQKAISDLGFRRDAAGNVQIDDSSRAKGVLENIDQKIDEAEDYFWRPLDSPEVYSDLRDLASTVGDSARKNKYQKKIDRIKANDLEFKGRIESFYGNQAEAFKFYEQAVALTPDHPLAGPGKEKTAKSLEKAKKDVEKLESSITAKAEDGGFWYKYALCHLTLGNLEDASGYFDKAIKFSPDNPDAYAKKGTTLESMKRYEDARPFFEKALELKPSSMIAKRGLNYISYFTEGGELPE